MSTATVEELPSDDPADLVRARARRRRLGFVAFGVLAVLAGRRIGAAVAGSAPADLREDEDL